MAVASLNLLINEENRRNNKGKNPNSGRSDGNYDPEAQSDRRTIQRGEI